MRAFLLAGGYGTRLRPITDNIPKCLVPVGGKPLLDYWLEALFEVIGCEKVLINTHYLHNLVERHVAKSPYHESIELVHEDSLLGTLGSLRANKDFFSGKNLLLAHADNLCLLDWQDFKLSFDSRPDECDLTLMLFHTDNPSSCGMVEVGRNSVLVEYVEKPQGLWQGTLANGAVFLMSPDALNRAFELPITCNDFCRDFLPSSVNKANCFINPNILVDIGTPAALEKANQLLSDLKITACT